jgi:hypothetical protein
MRTIRTTRQCAVSALLVLALLGLVASALAQSGGPYDLSWNTIDGGGYTFSSGGVYTQGGTIGQPDASASLGGGSYTLVGGFWPGGAIPTAVALAGFWVEVRENTLVACWETASEMDTLGFNVLRSDSGEPGSFAQLNEELIPTQAPGSPVGASYEWPDAEVEAGQTYFYLLEDVDVHGQATRHGPVSATLPPAAPYRFYLPLVNR